MPESAVAPARAEIRCLFCGQPERVEIFEVWGHEWMFETCCEGLHEQLAIEMADDPDWAKRFLRTLDLETFSAAASCRRVSRRRRVRPHPRLESRNPGDRQGLRQALHRSAPRPLPGARDLALPHGDL